MGVLMCLNMLTITYKQWKNLLLSNIRLQFLSISIQHCIIMIVHDHMIIMNIINYESCHGFTRTEILHLNCQIHWVIFVHFDSEYYTKFSETLYQTYSDISHDEDNEILAKLKKYLSIICIFPNSYSTLKNNFIKV